MIDREKVITEIVERIEATLAVDSEYVTIPLDSFHAERAGSGGAKSDKDECIWGPSPCVWKMWAFNHRVNELLS